jgi:two-component system NtrC family sensor kinase
MVVAAFDRLLVVFCPLAMAAIAFGLPLNERLGGHWVSAVHLAALFIGLATAWWRRRIGASTRLALYSSAFAAAAIAESVCWGLSGNGFLLSFVAVLVASVSKYRALRRGVPALVFAGLVGAAVGHVGGGFPWAETGLPASWAAWASALAVFGFACSVIIFWRRLGEGLHRTNEDLRLAEGHFRMMFDMAGDAILMLEQGRIIETNAQARQVFGYSAEEFAALAPEAVSPDTQANGCSSVAEARRLFAAAAEQPMHFRWMHRRKDGRLFEAEVSLSSVLHGARRIHLAIVRDLSDYRLVERENRLLATALNHAGEAVAITDAAGRIAYVNRAFEEITGFSRHEVHGQNPRILKSGRHDAAFYQEMWATISSGRAWRGRLQNRRKDGVIYTENTCITPLRDDRGAISHYVAVKRDISRELELEDQLVQSRKMEAVGRLAGGIAHDFNNILQVITGNVAMAAMDAPAGHPVHGSLDEISRAGERAVNLVQQLLAFSRREELRLRPIEIGALVADTARMLRRLIGEDITLEIAAAPAALPVLGDPVRIEQVLLNLCVNARDAMPEGGRITVETEIIELDADYCRIHPEARPGRHVVVAVSDDGCGIPKEIQHRIFEPFFSTKEVGRGTGLGLATVYAIIRQHGGFINLYSEVGLGTTFRFYLPHAPVAVAAETAAPPPDLATLHGRGETILIAEDDEQVLTIAHRVLAQANYRVLTARDGDEALAVHEAHDGPIALAILDVVMPRRNGRLTHDELRRRDPALPVLFATGYSYHHLQDGLFEETQVLRKPFTPRELLGRVRAALDERAAGAVVPAE